MSAPERPESAVPEAPSPPGTVPPGAPRRGPEPFLTVKAAAAFLSLSERAVRGLLARGAIPAVRLPLRRGGVRLDPEELRAWTRSGCPPAADFRAAQENRKKRA